MSETTFRFELVCPEGMVLAQDVENVLIPGSEGDFMIMANHAPIISTMRPGILEINIGEDGHKKFYVSSGLAEVNPLTLTILAEQAIDTGSIDKEFFSSEIKELQSELDSSQDENRKDFLVSQLDTMKSIANTLDIA